MSIKMSKVLFVGLCLLASLFVYACSTAQTSATLGQITGTILAADGTTPIAGATVYLKSDPTKIVTADANGQFTLSGSWIVAGSYTLVAVKGGFSLEFSVTVAANNQTTNVGSKEINPSNPSVTVPKLAVVLGTWDFIENIIADLGYTYEVITVNDLNANYTYISTFDAIFIDCGTTGSSLNSSGESHLQTFVESVGGSLYVSDWAANYIDGIWPTAIYWYGGTVGNAKKGIVGSLEATVVDSSLQTLLGKTSAIVSYDWGSWVIISAEGTGTTVLLRGNPQVSYVYASGVSPREKGLIGALSSYVAGTLEAVPLAVQFQPAGAAKGIVIYTTFHNEAQATNVTQDMEKILQNFIFTL